MSRVVWRGWPVLAALVACDPSAGFRQAPAVVSSAAAPPDWTVDLNRLRDGVFRSYAPRCLDRVRPGETVEFRNFLPELPANVSSISGPEILYSPNLVRPYNFVSQDDPENRLCDRLGPRGDCQARPSWSYWRHTFTRPGVNDWVDANQGAPGRRVVNPYYGTVTFVGQDPDTPTATICVLREEGGGCEGVCCARNDDCAGDQICLRSAVESVGLCRTPSAAL